MRDIGHDETEILLKQMEKRIAFEYMQAEKEIAAKLDDYLNKFKIKDELKQKALANGLITEQEYQQWRIGQIMMGKRWEEMRDALAKDFTNADKIAKSIAYGYQPDVYAINHNYGTFQVEKASRMDTSYTLYDRDTVAELMKNEDFIPAPGRKISAMINENKDLAWNKKQVQSVMMQGIIQGESISKMATRLAETVGDADRKAAIRNARTMTTGVENAGRMASYDRANDMGIKTQKQWLATLDFRTRHWHADLDGVAVNNDEPFHNEYGDIMYPGDPKADPANIYNCRCTMIASVKGFERDVSNTDLRHDDNLKGMSYKDWKEKHYKMESHSITKQDEIAEHMRNVYGAEYRKYSQLPDVEPVKTVEDYEKAMSDSLKKIYDEHGDENNLRRTSSADSGQEMFSVNYGKIDVESAKAFNETIVDLSKDYDSTLTNIRLMDKTEYLGHKDSFAFTYHNYETDISTLVINPAKFGSNEEYVNRITELVNNGYAVKIDEKHVDRYVATHEFAHTLIDTGTALDNNRNWVNTDYKKIRNARKEIESVYGDYVKTLGSLNDQYKKLEMDYMLTFNADSMTKAQEIKKQIDAITISKYSLNNADDFMAECFTLETLGGKGNGYSNKIMGIVNKNFRRGK